MVELSTYPLDKHEFSTPRIKYNGLVHINDLLQMVRGWYGVHKFKFNEKKLKHAYGSKGLTNEIEWVGDKSVLDYFKIIIKIKFVIKDAIEVEVVRDGQKEKLHQVNMIINIDGEMNYDPHGFIQKGDTQFSGLLGHNLRKLYHRIMKKKFIFEWEDELETLVKELHQKIIEHLKFESTVSI